MSDYDDDSDSCPISVNRMEMSNERIKRLLASRYGYRMCQHDRREGVIAFEKLDEDGNKVLVRVWYRTGTVGTYFKHPRQGKTQMFRKDIGKDNWSLLENIFANPRIHTNLGYQTKPNTPNSTPASERTVPCPACGRMYKKASGSVAHFESGKCPSCPGEENARRTAYDFVNKQNANFVVPRLGNGDENEGSGGGYRADDVNYRCQGCTKEFKLLNSLMQHQSARAQCRAFGSPHSSCRACRPLNPINPSSKERSKNKELHTQQHTHTLSLSPSTKHHHIATTNNNK